MPGTPFTATVNDNDGTVLIRLTGDVNRAAQAGMEEAYQAAQPLGGPIVLDFVDVDYINSTGIAVIVGLLAKARASGRPVRAFGLSDHYREIFQITRISDFMSIFENETAAVGAG